MHNTLEGSKFFPYIAWTLVVTFALFTYFVTVQVRAELLDLGENTNQLEAELGVQKTKGG